MSTVQITQKGKPLLPVINLQKNGGGNYVFNHFLSNYDFYLRYLTCRPPFDSVGGTFEMMFSHVNPASLNSILNNIEEGNELAIWIGKSDATKKKVFLGTIEEIETQEWSRKWMDVILRGPDWGSMITKGRVVNGYWEQAKLADGETLDTTDTSTRTNILAKKLLQDPNSYLVPDITAEDQGVIVDDANIEDSGISLAQFAANAETLADKLGELDAADGRTNYIDANKQFIRKLPTVTNSGVLITDDYKDNVAATWAKDKIGFISIRRPFITNGSINHHGLRLLGLGGDQRTVDQKQETVTSSDGMDTLHRAVKFQPVQRLCPMIGVYLGHSGTVTADLNIELREDLGNSPTGDTVREMILAKGAINAAPGGGKWHYFKIGEELNTAKAYWIVLNKMGAAGNTVNWFKGSSGYVVATSSDDVSYSVSTGAGYAFRQYSSSPILSIVQKNNISASSKHFYERLYRKPSITDKKTMYSLLRSEAATAFKKKQALRFLCYAPDTLLEQGQKVYLRKQKSGRLFDDDFVVVSPEYIFEAGKKTLYQELALSRFVDYG